MRRRILLVEDNPDDAELTRAALEEHVPEVEIVVAEDGVAALEYLTGTGAHAQPPPPLPDVVLLDLNLPRMDGIELLERLRSMPATKRIPVVVLTSSLEEADRVRSYERGANSYVRKPVDFDEFSKVAERLGVYWLQINEPAPRADGTGR